MTEPDGTPDDIAEMVELLERFAYRGNRQTGPLAEEYNALVDKAEEVAERSLYEVGLEVDASAAALVVYMLLMLQRATMSSIKAEPQLAMGTAFSIAMRGVTKATLSQFSTRSLNGCHTCESHLSTVEAAVGVNCFDCLDYMLDQEEGDDEDLEE